MNSSDTSEVRELRAVVEAKRWQQRWLAEYLKSDGTFCDRITGNFIGPPTCSQGNQRRRGF